MSLVVFSLPLPRVLVASQQYFVFPLSPALFSVSSFNSSSQPCCLYLLLLSHSIVHVLFLSLTSFPVSLPPLAFSAFLSLFSLCFYCGIQLYFLLCLRLFLFLFFSYSSFLLYFFCLPFTSNTCQTSDVLHVLVMSLVLLPSILPIFLPPPFVFTLLVLGLFATFQWHSLVFTPLIPSLFSSPLFPFLTYFVPLSSCFNFT